MTGPQANVRPDVVQTVLVVDDHEGFRLRTRRLLERHRYHVIEAGDGATAITQARQARPDIVLLDIHLPDMDGFEVATELRAAGATAAILLISTHGAADVADRLRGSAVDGFIDKADLSARTIAATLAQRV
jgi:CheY-like chemotaxis protein